jgi:hypothetical protein
MTRRERLTVTVDPALIRAGQAAVASGRAESVSAWVNLALAERAAKERRLAAMGAAIAAYEAEAGSISAEELSAQGRADRESAIVVRGKPSPSARRHRRRQVA